MQPCLKKVRDITTVGLSIGEVARKYGLCENTLYRWKSKYGGMEVSDAKKLKRKVTCNLFFSVLPW